MLASSSVVGQKSAVAAPLFGTLAIKLGRTCDGTWAHERRFFTKNMMWTTSVGPAHAEKREELAKCVSRPGAPSGRGVLESDSAHAVPAPSAMRGVGEAWGRRVGALHA